MNEDAEKLTVILLSCVWGIFGVLSLPLIMIHQFTMHVQGSLENIRALTSFWSLATFPLVCIFSVFLSFCCNGETLVVVETHPPTPFKGGQLTLE